MSSPDNLRNETLNFGPKIKEMRLSRNFTVRQVALQAGISSSFWSQVENKKREIPKTTTLKKMAKGLRVPEDEIFKLAGISNDSAPQWATDQDRIDLDKMLQSNVPMGFGGMEWSQEDKKKIRDVLIGLYWDQLKELRDKEQK